MEDTQPQSRSVVVLTLLGRGLAWGLLGTLVGALLGYLFAGHTLIAALNGINWAGLALAAFAGCLVLGHAQGRRVDAYQMGRMGSGVPHLPASAFPWGGILVTLFASGTCALIWFLASRFL